MNGSRSLLESIAADAARFYTAAGRFALHFARGKLGHDPAFPALLERSLVPDRARLVDLGCGQGVLAAWLLAAREHYDRGRWPPDWPAPPRLGTVLGVDLRAEAIRRARIALGPRARFEVGDIRRVALPACDAIVLLDVLHYLPPADQAALLAACARALDPGGVLITRIADAGAGLRYHLTTLGDRAVTILRGTAWPRLYCRRLADWIAALERAGFAVESAPMSAGTPFANVMLVGRRAAPVAAVGRFGLESRSFHSSPEQAA
jgi:SAM-dependent methyltransferase